MGRRKTPNPQKPAIDRVLPRIISNGECWEFVGYRDRLGYGRVGVGKHVALVHRVTYEYFIADIPERLELDHLCRNASCCNPWHLDPVTHKINVQRGRAGYAADDQCKHGHDLSNPANVYRHTRDQKGRKCKPCALRNAKARHQRLKEKNNDN